MLLAMHRASLANVRTLRQRLPVRITRNTLALQTTTITSRTEKAVVRRAFIAFRAPSELLLAALAQETKRACRLRFLDKED